MWPSSPCDCNVRLATVSTLYKNRGPGQKCHDPTERWKSGPRRHTPLLPHHPLGSRARPCSPDLTPGVSEAAQLCLTPCDPVDAAPAPGLLSAGIFMPSLEWGTFPGDLPNPAFGTQFPCLQADALPSPEPPGTHPQVCSSYPPDTSLTSRYF